MNIRKYKPKSYSLERSVDSNFIHAEKLAKITAQNVERCKKTVKRTKQVLEKSRNLRSN